MQYEEILFDTSGEIAFLTLNNTKRINALSQRMIGEIIHVLQQLPMDETIKVLIVRAAETLSLARQIANASRLTLGLGKQGFYAQVDQADDKALHYAKHTIALNNLTEDARTGIKAFLNRATPQWQNR